MILSLNKKTPHFRGVFTSWAKSDCAQDIFNIKLLIILQLHLPLKKVMQPQM